VHKPGADIDTILVAPNVCTREEFFRSDYVPPDGLDLSYSEDPTSAPRDPDSLAERIRNHPGMTNFVPVENAAIPIPTFDWEGVNIDLLYGFDNAPSSQDSLVTEEKVLSEVEREADILRVAGYSVVSDDEAIIVGGNLIPSWRNLNVARSSRILTKVGEKSASEDDGGKK